MALSMDARDTRARLRARSPGEQATMERADEYSAELAKDVLLGGGASRGLLRLPSQGVECPLRRASEEPPAQQAHSRAVVSPDPA